MELKRVQVHMLPTEESIIHKHKDSGQLFISIETTSHNTIYDNEPQHLYFTTDEKIKEKDWYLDTYTANEIIKSTDKSVKREAYIVRQCGTSLPFTGKKIIASTDPKLYKEVVHPTLGIKESMIKLQLPQPSPVFIEKYCRVSGIDEVNVEYEIQKNCVDFSVPCIELTNTCKANNCTTICTPKVDSHNTITIHSIKDTWNREEVENILGDFLSSIEFYDPERIDKWIKENL